MANNVYVGNRYVPVFADPVEWDSLRSYEALTIVTYLGTSYTSKKTVPAGTQLSNTEYWVVTGNYNAQVQQLINTVNDMSDDVETAVSNANQAISNANQAISKANQAINGVTSLSENVEINSDSYVTPEMYNAYGDGVHDDSNAILTAFTEALNNHKILILSKKYLIGTAVTLDFVVNGGGYGSVDIICSGTLVMNNTLTLVHGSASNISLKITGGTLNTGDACVIGYMEHCTFNLIATTVPCTAFKIGGNDGPLHWCDISLFGNNNYRTLHHGDTGTAGTSLENHATGRYLKLIDNGRDLPIRFDEVYDLNIEYFEGHFSNPTHDQSAFIYNGGASLHIGVYAQGGKASHMMELNNVGDVTVDYLFMMGEDYSSPYPNAGIKIVNTDLTVSKMRGLYLSKIIDNDSASTIRITNDLSKNYDSYLTNLVTKTDIRGIRFNIKGALGTVTNVPTTNISLDVNGDMVHLSGEVSVTGNISAYGTLVTFTSFLGKPDETINGCFYDASGNGYPYYRDGNDIKTRKAISSGTTIFLDARYNRAKV